MADLFLFARAKLNPSIFEETLTALLIDLFFTLNFVIILTVIYKCIMAYFPDFIHLKICLNSNIQS